MEYYLKILNYLAKNDNGEFHEITSLHSEFKALISIANELKKENYIEIKPTGVYVLGTIDDIKTYGSVENLTKCYAKITLKGHEYIKANSSQNRNSNELDPIKKKSRIQIFFYNPYTVTILGGLVLAFIVFLFSLNNSAYINNSRTFHKPFFDLNAYKIQVENKTYPTIDTLSLKVFFQGSKITLNRNFKIIDLDFSNKKYFFIDPNIKQEPEISVLEALIENLIVDSSNTSEIIVLQLKRKMILNGYEVAWFKTEDKIIIGNLSLAFSYNYNGEIINDTLQSAIYLVNKSEKL
ncbi:MAG: hypothetical protein WBM13_09480 [Bacteroidia bacterium]